MVDKAASAEDAAGTLDGTEVVRVSVENTAGFENKQTTTQAIADLGGGGVTSEEITSGSDSTAANPETDVTVWTLGETKGVETVTLALPVTNTAAGRTKIFLVVGGAINDNIPKLDTTNFIGSLSIPNPLNVAFRENTYTRFELTLTEDGWMPGAGFGIFYSDGVPALWDAVYVGGRGILSANNIDTTFTTAEGTFTVSGGQITDFTP